MIQGDGNELAYASGDDPSGQARLGADGFSPCISTIEGEIDPRAVCDSQIQFMALAAGGGIGVCPVASVGAAGAAI